MPHQAFDHSNYNNGQSVNIPETTYPKFRIGQKLKDACNK